MLSVALIRALFEQHPETHALHWRRSNPSRGVKAGDAVVASFSQVHGLRVRIGEQQTSLHRIAWALQHRCDAPRLSFLDGDKGNLAPHNLCPRSAAHSVKTLRHLAAKFSVTALDAARYVEAWQDALAALEGQTLDPEEYLIEAQHLPRSLDDRVGWVLHRRAAPFARRPGAC